MDFELSRSIEILERTPGVLRAMLAGLSEPWVRNNYGPDTFSPFDVVGHLIHGEKADWMARIRMILEHGPNRTFDPFDRYAMFEASKGRTLGELLDEFERLRRRNIEDVRALNLTAEVLQRKGTHPALGSVTLENLLATWAVHDLNHIAQVCKAMAWQHKEAVGPWSAYLSILPKA